MGGCVLNFMNSGAYCWLKDFLVGKTHQLNMCAQGKWRRHTIFLFLVTLGLSCVLLAKNASAQSQLPITHETTEFKLPEVPGCPLVCKKRHFNETAVQIENHLMDERIKLEKWMISDLFAGEVDGVPGILPAKQYQAEQGSATQSEATKLKAGLSDHLVAADTVTSARGEMTEALLDAQVSDRVCDRISLRAYVNAAREETHERAHELQAAGRSTTSGAEGSVSGTGLVDFQRTRVATFEDLLCDRSEANGAFRENCNSDDPDFISADVNPDKLLGRPTVDFTEKDENEARSVMTAFMTNVCALRPVDLPATNLPESGLAFQISDNFAQSQIADTMCVDSYSNLIALHAAGEAEMSPQMRAQLEAAGYSADLIEQNFGNRPSELARILADVRVQLSVDAQISNAASTERDVLIDETATIATQLNILRLSKESMNRRIRNMAYAIAPGIKDLGDRRSNEYIQATSGANGDDI